MRSMSKEKPIQNQNKTPIPPNQRTWKKMDDLFLRKLTAKTHPEEKMKPSKSTVGEHAHRWRIDEPNGETSMGKCNGCGEEKQFKNHDKNLDFLQERD